MHVFVFFQEWVFILNYKFFVKRRTLSIVKEWHMFHKKVSVELGKGEITFFAFFHKHQPFLVLICFRSGLCVLQGVTIVGAYLKVACCKGVDPSNLQQKFWHFALPCEWHGAAPCEKPRQQEKFQEWVNKSLLTGFNYFCKFTPMK